MTWPYRAIEEWWGESFDARLARRITQAPWNQLEAFVTDVSLANREPVLPILERGNVRPLVIMSPIDRIWRGYTNPSDLSSTVRRLLLYAHEVAIEDPFEELSAFGLRLSYPNRDRINKALMWLVELKPLAELGLAVRTQSAFISKKHHPSFSWNMNLNAQAVESDLLDTNSRFRSLSESDRRELLDDVSVDVGSTLLVLGRELSIGRCHFLARSDVEDAIHRVAIDEGGSKLIDGRRSEMRKLLTLGLPDLHPKLSDLIALRKSSDEFYAWRAALSHALAKVEQIDDSVEQWGREARGIVHAELEPLRGRLEGAVNKSPALEAVKFGSTGITVSGIGALFGFIAGDSLTSAIASAGASKLTESALKYIENLRARRAGRAVLDLALSFKDD